MLEKTLESPLDCKEIQPVYPKGVQSWVFIGKTDVEAETPIIWPPHAKSWFIEKDPDAGKDWGQEEKGMTEDEMVGWHHRLNGHGFGWTPGVGDWQEGLACWGSWGHRVGHHWVTELNWTELLFLRSPAEYCLHPPHPSHLPKHPSSIRTLSLSTFHKATGYPQQGDSHLDLDGLVKLNFIIMWHWIQLLKAVHTRVQDHDLSFLIPWTRGSEGKHCSEDQQILL